MKAKELMIGDYVLVRPSMMPIQVAAIHKKKVAYHATGDRLTWVRDGLIEPIPITPEILEKNGWKVKKGFVQHGNFSDGPLMLWHTEENKILRNFTHELEISDLSTDKGFRVIIECNYVHQLQHALRLCGIEKEIVL